MPESNTYQSNFMLNNLHLNCCVISNPYLNSPRVTYEADSSSERACCNVPCSEAEIPLLVWILYTDTKWIFKTILIFQFVLFTCCTHFKVNVWLNQLTRVSIGCGLEQCLLVCWRCMHLGRHCGLMVEVQRLQQQK